MGYQYQATVFNQAAGGTKYTDWVQLEDNEEVTYQVEHPAATTTAYTHQVSNSESSTVGLGTSIPIDDPDVAIPSKSSAENFGVDPAPVGFRMSRLKLVTTAGNGAIRVTAHVKRR